MKTTEHFLCEIGTEELPATSIAHYINQLQEQFEKILKHQKLKHGPIKCFSTPRRLTILIHDLITQQPDQTIEKTGPSLHLAYDDKKNPTPAALGFAKSCGVDLKELHTIKTDKGECLLFKKLQPGLTTFDLLPTMIEQAILNIQIKKPMRWGEQKTPFIRPVKWLLTLLGNKIVPLRLFDLEANRFTYGHRFHHPEAIEIQDPLDYEHALKKAFVMANFEERKNLITQQLKSTAEQLKADAVIEPNFLEEVAYLVEWPVTLLASFARNFLALPKEVLMASMQIHQRVFPIEKNGELLPYFILVSNLQSNKASHVIHGNERVMRARLEDAHFFFEHDQKRPLIDYVDNLKKVIYQTKLGTLYDKAERITELASQIAHMLKIDVQLAASAAQLTKCDLVTDMVGEFPELQGTIGGYYAKLSGVSDEIATAISEHYWPRFAGDKIPSTLLGCVIGLADRLDTLVGIFSLHRPSGTQDPYSLRRTALGIIRIIIENQIHLDLTQLLKLAEKQYASVPKLKIEPLAIEQFIQERAMNWYASTAHSKADEWIAASHSEKKTYDLTDIHQRALALAEFRQLPNSEILIQLNKRLDHLLEKNTETVPTEINTKLLRESPEKQLHTALLHQIKEQTQLIKEKKYKQMLHLLVELQQPLHDFFDQVMVMIDDEALRLNRLALLNQLQQLFRKIGDVSLLNG